MDGAEPGPLKTMHKMGKLSKTEISNGLKVLKDKMDGKLLTHLNSCVRCGLCADSCIYYMADPDARFIPAMKVGLISSVYRRHNTLLGRIAPRLAGGKELNDDTVQEMVDLFYGACTLCGRCVPHCSIGVDISFLVRKGREMLANMGCVPATLQSTIDAAINTGNNMSITTEEFVDTIKWLEEDLQVEVDDPCATIPLNEKDKEVLYTLNPREPKFFPLSISAMAKIFYFAKESWTFSTKMYDVTNYAYYSGNLEEATVIAGRLADEMADLNAGMCVLAECGHGSRAFRWEGPNYLKKQYDFDVITSIELIHKYLIEGKITVDPKKNSEPVTLHDPCNLARTGGIWMEQRHILKQCVQNFIEMTPYGTDNICCGGGGGQLAMSEFNQRRMKTGELKAQQIRKTGAKVVVTPCHNCVDQLMQINVAFKLGVQIKTVAEIVADAIVAGSQVFSTERQEIAIDG
jgi:Fe-S oxidoreductase